MIRFSPYQSYVVVTRFKVNDKISKWKKKVLKNAPPNNELTGMRKLGVSVLIIRTHFSNINDRHQDINLCKFLDTIMQHMNAKKKKRLSMSKNVHFIVCLFFIQRTSILQNCSEECRCTECIQLLSSKNLTGGGVWRDTVKGPVSKMTTNRMEYLRQIPGGPLSYQGLCPGV